MLDETPKSIKSPAFQFYPNEFIGDEEQALMSLAEAGVYIRLLCRCWTNGSLPDAVPALAQLCGATTSQMAKMWPAVAKCFKQRQDGRWIHTRLEKERKKQADYRQRQTDASAKRWDKRGSPVVIPPLSHGNPMGIPLQQSSSSSSSSSSSIQTTSKSERRAPIHDSSHRAHAHCGRVCIPAFLHSEFVRRWPVCPDPEMAARDWYLAIEREWADRPDALPEPKAFWQARFTERWPASVPVKVDTRIPEWARS